MSEERFTERQKDVRKATERLIQAVQQPESDILRDAAIQRFEFSFELVWKTLKLYLERQGHECGGPRSTLKKAFTEGLISTPEDGDVWLQMLEDRNLTTHTYDEELAIRIYRHIAASYAELLGKMADRIEGLTWD
jgi:nucleotidyltransferase substrate binding protein (TIGR01987 family)